MCNCPIFIVEEGKWLNEKCVVESKTAKGYFVYLINRPLTNFERLVFGKNDIVYGAKPKFPRVYTRQIQKTNERIDINLDDPSGKRLLRKWHGKSKSYVQRFCR